ncbi:DNA polymerase III subunit delta' [Halochromatium sp.]
MVDRTAPSVRTSEPVPPWLEAIWQRLLDAHRHARLGQALLFSGPLGIGKRILAEHLAGMLLCVAPQADGRACGACADCRLLEAGNHPDRLLLEPAADAASGEIRAEQVRQLCARETLTPMRGSTKVLIIRPADAMNLFAANSLLKTLEEPADSTVWVLVTEHPQRLSQTIRSRCQQISMISPQLEQALPWLETRLETRLEPSAARQGSAGAKAPSGTRADAAAALPAQRAAHCLALAQGAPFRALALAETGALEQRRDLLDDLIGIAQGERDPLGVAHEWQRLELSAALAAMIDALIDSLRLGIDPAGARIIHLGARQALAALAGQIEAAAGHRFLRLLLQTRSAIDAPMNQQILFEALLVRWARLTRASA